MMGLYDMARDDMGSEITELWGHMVFRGHQWGYGSHRVVQGYGVISGYGSCEVMDQHPPLGYRDLQSPFSNKSIKTLQHHLTSSTFYPKLLPTFPHNHPCSHTPTSPTFFSLGSPPWGYPNPPRHGLGTALAKGKGEGIEKMGRGLGLLGIWGGGNEGNWENKVNGDIANPSQHAHCPHHGTIEPLSLEQIFEITHSNPNPSHHVG